MKLAPFGLFLVLWLDLCRLLARTWDTREQYAYGWFVPIFAAYLLWRRMADAPPPGPLRASRAGWLATGGVMALLVPLRVIIEINADWPLMTWSYTLAVVWLTAWAFALRGGWRMARHFLFPVAFICVAVAWPYRIEKAVTQGLMEVVAAITVEALRALQIPAIRRGNLVEVATGLVGIDEACSGIRSLQGTLMGALLLGEMYRLRAWLRAMVVACGLCLAFWLNVTRTVFLAWQAGVRGPEALDRWHDPAGLAVLGATFAGLWMLAAFAARRGNTPAGGTGADAMAGGSSLRVHSLPPRYLTAIGVWALLAVGVTEAWYRSHEDNAGNTFHWRAELPASDPTYHAIEIEPWVAAKIGHDEGSSGGWLDGEGNQWSAYFFRWNPRSIESAMLARAHRPDVCLPAAGLRQVADEGIVKVPAAGMKLPFRQYVFESAGRRLHVFFCQWESGRTEQDGLGASKQRDRLRSVLTGRRRIGQQTLELVLAGLSDPADARAALERRLPALITRE